MIAITSGDLARALGCPARSVRRAVDGGKDPRFAAARKVPTGLHLRFTYEEACAIVAAHGLVPPKSWATSDASP